MRRRPIDPARPGEDWEGNNIAVTCPVCTKVYIVSQLIHRGERQCPVCGQSRGHVDGGRQNEGSAEVSWQWSGDGDESA